MNHSSFLKTAAKTVAALLGIFMLSAEQTKANNVIISGVGVAGADISFNIQWENSWNTAGIPNNWDAVWVFIKYKDCATTNWLHATTIAPPGVPPTFGSLQVDYAADQKGAFIRRSAVGTGNIAATNVTISLILAGGPYDFKVFGIEMVRVLQEDFYVGDGVSTGGFQINQTFGGASPSGTSLINAATQAAGIPAANLTAGGVAVPNTYPMGQGAFYAMKYEISQEEYVDFLNTLTYDQQYTRTNTGIGFQPFNVPGTFVMSGANAISYRNGICIVTSGVFNTTPAVYGCNAFWGAGGAAGTNPINDPADGQVIPCGYLSWDDLKAYLDWAALRPMTELEYEKICRGPVARLAGEYAWSGNLTITQAKSYSGAAANSCVTLNWYISGQGATTELTSAAGGAGPPITGDGLCVYGNPGCHANVAGPMRCGITATPTTSRITSGAGRYGSMDMSGNLGENTVSAVNATGVAYTGVLGDGALTAAGNANAANWPASAGTIVRGGEWWNNASYCRVSDRNWGSAADTRYQHVGGRGVRQ